MTNRSERRKQLRSVPTKASNKESNKSMTSPAEQLAQPAQTNSLPLSNEERAELTLLSREANEAQYKLGRTQMEIMVIEARRLEEGQAALNSATRMTKRLREVLAAHNVDLTSPNSGTWTWFNQTQEVKRTE